MTGRKHSATTTVDLALGEALGAAVILDANLKVVAFSPAAKQLIPDLEPGLAVVAALCGQSEQRPVAEALIAGRAVRAEVPRPARDGLEPMTVRTSPLHDSAGVLQGHMITLTAHVGETLDAPLDAFGIMTRAPSMRALMRQVEKVAKGDATVLIRGETGTGKELVARAIHAQSPRVRGPFRAVNCAALPPDLLESALFGHVRGAFTGAHKDNVGYFRATHRGTLFLDEVAELPLALQSKMLRVLQERVVVPVGSADAVPVDVRIVSATHQSLRAKVKAQAFREDLMYRLRVIPLYLPALRERPGDVALLAHHFVEAMSPKPRNVSHIAEGALRALERYAWPGNIRELQNVIEYAVTMGDSAAIVEADLPPEIQGHADQPVSNQPADVLAATGKVRSAEDTRLLQALERAGGHKERAAKMLGISRATLWRRLKRIETGHTHHSS